MSNKAEAENAYYSLNPRVDGAFLCLLKANPLGLAISLNPRVDGAFLCL